MLISSLTLYMCISAVNGQVQHVAQAALCLRGKESVGFVEAFTIVAKGAE